MRAMAIIPTTVILFITACNHTKVIYCPENKKPVIIIKDYNKFLSIYPDVGNNQKVNADLSTNTPTTKGEAKGEYNNTVSNFRELLNQENIRIENLLKTALLGLQTTPCDEDARKNFWSIINKVTISDEVINSIKQEVTTLNIGLTSISSQVSKLSENSQNIGNQFNTLNNSLTLIQQSNSQNKLLLDSQITQLRTELERLQQIVSIIQNIQAQYKPPAIQPQPLIQPDSPTQPMEKAPNK